MKDTVHIVCYCPALMCIGYSVWGDMFLRLMDLENVRVGSLISLVANARLGLSPLNPQNQLGDAQE